MSRKALLLLVMLIVGKCYAQENYFVLIQSDNNQPFYVRLEDKTFSSTFQGHLILSQLQSGRHSINIGFPKQSFPEQQYTFDINGKDLQFQLKEQQDKGWGVLNLQTQEWLPAEKVEPAASPHVDGIKKDDAFSRLMAGVVGDTAVMYNTYVMEAALKDSPVARRETKVDTPRGAPEMNRPPVDTTVTAGAPVRTDTPKVISTVMMPGPDTPRHASTVVKLSERKTSRGLRLAFADRTNGKKADTVVVIIPMDSSIATGKTAAPSPVMPTDSVKPEAVATTNGSVPVATEQVSEYKGDTLHLYVVPKKGAHNIPASGTANGTTSGTGDQNRMSDSSQKKAETKLVLVNSDCHNFATDYDVDKLRVKLLELSKDDDKIAAAKKIFKTKCFTTKQIRALSEVFAADAAKYKFFETSYPFVSDDRFRELTDLLVDPVYNAKFKAMTGQR